MALEAAMHQVPLLLPNVDGIREFFQNRETAILYESGKVSDLKNKLIELFENSKLRKRISKNALSELSSKFNADIIANKYYAIYNQILN